MSLGFGATLVPSWFSYVFTYSGDNHALQGFLDAIVLVMETGFAVNALVAIILNLLLPEEDEAEEIESLAGDIADNEAEMRIEASGAPVSKINDEENVHEARSEGIEREIEEKV
jgi:uric acid-xanthine permease